MPTMMSALPSRSTSSRMGAGSVRSGIRVTVPQARLEPAFSRVRRPGHVALLQRDVRAATIGSMTAVAQPSVTITTTPAVLRRARLGVMVAFLANGATFGTWATRIPEIRDRLGLSDSVLGFALLSIAAGAVLAMPIAGTLIARFSSRHMVLLGTLLMAIGLLTAGFAPSLLVLVPGLACLGV